MTYYHYYSLLTKGGFALGSLQTIGAGHNAGISYVCTKEGITEPSRSISEASSPITDIHIEKGKHK